MNMFLDNLWSPTEFQGHTQRSRSHGFLLCVFLCTEPWARTGYLVITVDVLEPRQRKLLKLSSS